MKIYMNELGNMTKMATVLMYGKNHLLQAELTYDLETQYVASGTRVLPILFK